MTYYKIINGRRYDRPLLETAASLIQGRGDGRISLDDAKELFQVTKADGLITTTEVRTLRYILDHFVLTAPAHTWLWDTLRGQSPLQRNIRSILREVFGLERMQWCIDDDDVAEHRKLYDGATSFPLALREIIDEFINGVESATSLRDVVSRRFDIDPEEDEQLKTKVLDALAEATLYFFPTDYLDQIRAGTIDFKYPPFTHRMKDYWPFGLRTPSLKDYYFIGFVSRNDWWDVYHTGYK